MHSNEIELPSLVVLDQYNGNWELYFEVIYKFFVKDFIEHLAKYHGIEIKLKRHPYIQDKEATFWHIISEGKIESERRPDLRRCERICWPRPIIENVPNHELKVWTNRRGSDTRICIWFERYEYLVVLNERKAYLILWTAYPVTQNHRKIKLQKDFEQNTKAAH